MAVARRRKRERHVEPPPPPSFRVVEGVIGLDEDHGVVLWEHLPLTVEGHRYGYACGGLIDQDCDGYRVRVTIEVLP